MESENIINTAGLSLYIGDGVYLTKTHLDEMVLCTGHHDPARADTVIHLTDARIDLLSDALKGVKNSNYSLFTSATLQV